MGNLMVGVVILLVFCLKNTLSTSLNTELTDPNTSGLTTGAIAKKLTDLWNWVGKFKNSENTFVGRCFGIAKKLQFVIPLIIFILGVIVTTLKFLTIFSLKGLGILVVLLMLNVGKIFGYFASLKTNHNETPHYEVAPHYPPQTVHFHLHNNKDGHYSVDHSGPSYEHGWTDRISEGLSKTTSLAEKIELLNLYKRLGFNVDSQSILSNFR